MKQAFRHPSEMKGKEERTPVSTRLRKSTKDFLEKEAKENKLSLAELIANALDDYADYLRDNPTKKKGS